MLTVVSSGWPCVSRENDSMCSLDKKKKKNIHVPLNIKQGEEEKKKSTIDNTTIPHNHIRYDVDDSAHKTTHH